MVDTMLGAKGRQVPSSTHDAERRSSRSTNLGQLVTGRILLVNVAPFRFQSV